MMKTYQDLFCGVPDPRVHCRCLHKLSDILFIAVCTLLANGEDCVDMHTFGKAHEEWLKQVIDLPNGIPSDDTFRRVLQIIDPDLLRESLESEWGTILDNYKDKLISIDGKKLRGADPTSTGNKGLYILSAWVSENGVCIGEEKVEDKSNEIKSIPKLLDKLDIEGSIVSIDAIGCQVEIAQKVLSKGADYLLSVKLNQKDLHEEITECFRYMPSEQHDEQWEYAHGRYETRRCEILDAQQGLSPILLEKWTGANQLIKIEATRHMQDEITTSSRYYISSLKDKKSMEYNAMVRRHWSIENHLHWHLDVTFREDENRMRSKNAPINMNILRKFALQKIKKMTDKSSLKKRRFMASLNAMYLREVLLA